VSLRQPPTGGNTSGPAKPVPRCFTKGTAALLRSWLIDGICAAA